LKVRPSYGVSVGPTMVAVQLSRSASFGNALMPGVGDIIRFMSSVCSLQQRQLEVYC